MSPWKKGVDEVRALLESGDLDQVVPSDEHAKWLLSEAARHVESASKIADEDPSGSIGLAYDGLRKSATALLATQGLRPTTKGGHVAVQTAVQAQFDPGFAGFGRMRRQRNAQEYPDLHSVPALPADAHEALTEARASVEHARKLLATGSITPWR